MLLLLANLVRAEERITLDSLEDGPGILPFDLGPTKITSQYHSFVQTINLDKIRSDIVTVRTQLDKFAPELHNKTLSLYEPHVQYLYTKLDHISIQLQTFEPNRVKRGLIDGLGSVIKSISGNLDFTDALRYDNAIKVLQDNDNKLLNEINNQMSISKQWVTHNSEVIAKLVENQGRMANTINSILESDARHETSLIKYGHLSQLFLILGDNIDNLSEELSTLENLLAFIRAKSMHNSMLDYNTLVDIINKLKVLYKRDEVLDFSYREYLNIIKPGYFYNNKDLILVYKVPIVYPKMYNLYKLTPAPNKFNKVIIPAYPFLAVHEDDFMYMETECPKANHWHLCDDQPNHHSRRHPDCIQHLITKQQTATSCQFTTVTLSTEAKEQLDDRTYVASFPNATRVRLSCAQEQYKTMNGSYLITVPRGCLLQTPEFTISNTHDRIQGQVLKIIDLPMEEMQSSVTSRSIKLNSINLSNLHESDSKIMLQHPVSLNGPQINSIYHTTIPVYLLLIFLIIIVTTVICRRYLRKRDLGDKISGDAASGPAGSNSNTTGIYSEIKEEHVKQSSHPTLFFTKAAK